MIRLVNIEKDLNLLNVFACLYRERNLSKAGVKLGLSQPAMSHALARLRRDFGDPLFVRSPRGMVPTPAAERIGERVERALEEVAALYREETFDPASSEGRLTIATTDYFEQSVLPRLLSRLNKIAPKLTLVCRPLTGVLPKEELEEGAYDLAIAGYFNKVPQGFFSQKLFDERFVCVMRKDHPASKGLTLDRYEKASHALITLQGDLRGRADVELEKLKRRRHVAVAVSNFLSSGWVVAESDLILTAPSRLSLRLRDYLPLEEQPVPFKLPGFTVIQVWHQRTHRDPLRRWFRELLSSLCREEV